MVTDTSRLSFGTLIQAPKKFLQGSGCACAKILFKLVARFPQLLIVLAEAESHEVVRLGFADVESTDLQGSTACEASRDLFSGACHKDTRD